MGGLDRMDRVDRGDRGGWWDRGDRDYQGYRGGQGGRGDREDRGVRWARDGRDSIQGHKGGSHRDRHTPQGYSIPTESSRGISPDTRRRQDRKRHHPSSHRTGDSTKQGKVDWDALEAQALPKQAPKKGILKHSSSLPRQEDSL